MLAKTLAEIYRKGYRSFYCGGALGFDTLAALEVLRLRQKHPDVRLIVVIPCGNQDARWPAASKLIYRQILKEADETVQLADHYFAGCMQIRNQYMIVRSGLCISYLRPECNSGGTWSTCMMAHKKGIPIINLANELTTEKLRESKCSYTYTLRSAKGNVHTADLFPMKTGKMKQKHISPMS